MQEIMKYLVSNFDFINKDIFLVPPPRNIFTLNLNLIYLEII